MRFGAKAAKIKDKELTVQIFPSRNEFQKEPAAAALLAGLEKEISLDLAQAILYRYFPFYRDDDGGLIMPDCVLLSPWHGVIALALTSASVLHGKELERCREIFEQVPPFIHSKLIKNRILRSTSTSLLFPIEIYLYGPLLHGTKPTGFPVVQTDSELRDLLELKRLGQSIATDVFQELVATVDGAKGLIRPKRRDFEGDERSKGKQAEKIEAAITLFDQRQKNGMIGQITGPQRIRGLAGSGKTVVLAMKAAQTHLLNPESRIAFTFYTKSLYQHVKRLITRFYRQFDDRDPDWDRLQILHGWGSSSTPGLYSVACEQHDVTPLPYREAAMRTLGDAFGYACNKLLEENKITPIFDYIFIDEGQDFPLSFVRLCHSLAREGKFTLAYDDLQTIFQASTPSATEIFGVNEDNSPKASFEEDVVLHKCYRNPRELLVVAHALGFGLYGPRIVQMLESPEHWEDIGYEVVEGEFEEGQLIKVERPKENSLAIISDISGFDEIVQVRNFDTLDSEVSNVVSDIINSLRDGLKPEDILVVSVDDRHAKEYLTKIEGSLAENKILSNNLHTDSFGIRDFAVDGRVTLSTVHKAKGNEAFMVYVVGVDAVMRQPDVRRRNMLFTALTRAKGWVRASGCGKEVEDLLTEVTTAKTNFPYLIFEYPGPETLKVMKRDLAEAADRKLKLERLMDELGDEYTPEEISAFIDERRKKQRNRDKQKNA